MRRRIIGCCCAMVFALVAPTVAAEQADQDLSSPKPEQTEPLEPIPAGGPEILLEDQFVPFESCGPCPESCGPCPAPPARRPLCPWSWGYAKTDYLMWWTKGMWVPPLVTTSPGGTDQNDAGVLGRPGTSIVFGDTGMLEEERSGGRLVVGIWRDPERRFGVEGEYVALGTVGDRFVAESDGDPILARPFYNALDLEQDSELVAFPDVVVGRVGVNAHGRFTSAGARVRLNGWSQPGCFQPDPCSCVTYQGYQRWDLLLGYRFVRLDETLAVREVLSGDVEGLPTDFDILDVFDTENRFHGGEFGIVYESKYNRWSLEMLGKIAMGNSHQVVTIDGSTDRVIDVQGTPVEDSFSAGILAQRTNIGTYTQDRFAVVPEAGITLGYDLTRRLKFTFGYSFIYWSRVARPGRHIDLVLNPNLFPEEADPFSGPLRPRFTARNTGFWAQGISFGLDYRW